MKVLIACEFSGIVRDAFRAKGHDAWSCDILPTERPGPHIQDDCRKVVTFGWDLMIAHPPCTHLCIRGAWHSKRRRKPEQIDEALLFVKFLYDAPIAQVAIENPIGVMSTRWRKPTQIIHPWEFGHRERKATCLWLRNLPPLFVTCTRIPEQPISRDATTGKKRYSFDEIDKVHGRRAAASIRAKTFQGIANAMADQWG